MPLDRNITDIFNDSCKVTEYNGQNNISTNVPDSSGSDSNVLYYMDPKFKNTLRRIHPSREMYVIGITGTNGKTTVAHLIGKTLKTAGHNPFVLGTLNSGDRDLTTPSSTDIARYMQAHLDQGGTHFILEVTSEAIDQQRIRGVDFDLKILTNITQDHLDYHLTFENYSNAKLGFMNAGTAHKILPGHFAKESIAFSHRMLGEFNLLNIKAAACALRHMGIDENDISSTLSICPPPRGRLENIEYGQSYLVLIDYAHTPDALYNVLTTIKHTAQSRQGRLMVMFGCGGNRDSVKRPDMGRIASEIADFVVITEDNPRLEESKDIIADIVAGISSNFREFRDYVLIQNRRKAINFIINQASDNDIVILAGKGHETYQVLNTGVVHFDDREEASNAILNRQTLNLLSNA